MSGEQTSLDKRDPFVDVAVPAVDLRSRWEWSRANKPPPERAVGSAIAELNVTDSVYSM